MPALIITSEGIIMKRIISVKQAAEYSHLSVREIKRSFPYGFINCGRKGIGVDTKDLDRWIDHLKCEENLNTLDEAINKL